jgi:hypothetical protein
LDSYRFGGLDQDAQGRDFTINAMYIPLTQSDGENSELIDPHGGAHHLKNGEVKFINSPLDKMRDDPMTAFRYLNTAGKYGKLNQIGDKEKAAIGQFRDMGDVDPAEIRKSFLGGLEDPDVDARSYMGAAKGLGLLNVVFPDLEFREDDMPPDFRGDRWLAPAWILRDNDPEKIKKVLSSGGWSKQEASDIAYLVKIAGWAEKEGFNPEKAKELKKGHSGLTKAKIREWLQMIGKGDDQGAESLFRGGDDDEGGEQDTQAKPQMGDRKPMAAQGHPGVKQAAPEKGGEDGGEGGEDSGEDKKENTAWGRMLNKLNERKSRRAEAATPTQDGWIPLIR